MRYALPAFLPDQLPRGNVLVRAENVYPAPGGYRAAQGFVSVSDALPAAFRGGASFVSTSGTAYLLAGTATTLSRLSGGAWVNLLTGLTIAGRWKFSQFGDFVVAVNGGTTYEVDLNAGTAAALVGAPSAIDTAVVGDFVVLAQPNGDLLRVAWSAFNDHTGWTIGVNQAGDQPMLTGGEVMGIAGGEYGVILQRNRFVRMTRTGDPTGAFAFDEISNNFGCASKASIVAVGRSVFCLSDRGFIAIESGQDIRPIGDQKFDRSFRESLGPDDFERLWTAVDPERTRVMWGIPGQQGKVWVYDWSLDQATVLSLPFDGLFAGFENSTDLDSLTALYPDLDAMPYTLDDPRWSGGAPRLYVVQDGEVGTLAGMNLAAVIETGEFAPAENNRLRLRAVWPDTDARNGIVVKAFQSQRKGDTPLERTSGSMQASGRMALQANGKYMAFRVTIDDPDWTYIDALVLEANAGGLR